MSKGVKIRLASVGHRFRDSGFDLSKSWSEIDVDSLSETQIKALRARAGRWIRIHPDDAAKVEALIGKPEPEGPKGDPADETTNTINRKAAKADIKAAKAGKKEG